MRKCSTIFSGVGIIGSIMGILPLVSPNAYPQSANHSIAGTIRDTTGQLLPGVNVLLLMPGDSTPVKAMATSADGAYHFQNINAGRYLLKASLIGYATLASPVFTVGENAGQSVRQDITLHETVAELNAVNITARKQTIEIDRGKLVYNVANSALASGASALDLLRRVPGVSIGQDDQITLKGASGINVMIDGKMTYLSENQLIQLLRGTNAENIAKVEVIASPTAEFDAAGNSGIINFVMKTGQSDGYSLEFRSAVSKGRFWMLNENLAASYRSRKLTLSASFDYNMPYRFMESKNGNAFAENGEQVTIRREMETPTKIHFYTYKAQADWQLAPRHQLNAGYHGYLDDYVKDNALSTVSKYSSNENLLGIVKSNNYLEEPYHYDAANLGYQFQIDSLGKKLTANAHYISYRNFSDGSLSTEYFDPAGAPATPRELLCVHQPGTVGISSVKADFDLPFAAFTLKTGLKYADIRNKANYRFDSLLNGEFVEAASMSNTFRYREKIAAAYVSLGRKFEKTSIEAGLRIESTQANGYTVEAEIENRWRYTKLFPSLSIDQVIDRDNKVNLSVSRRINRPTYSNLNPVRWYYDQYFFYAGNPYLKPELAWIYSLGYTWKEQYALTASYSRRSDYISKRLVIEPGTNAIVSQSANFESMERFDLILSVPLKPAAFWDIQFTGGTNYTSYPVPLLDGMKTLKKWAGNAILSQQFKLPTGFQMELSATWLSDELWGIYGKRSIFFADFGLRKSLLKNKFDVRFSFNDFLRTNRYRGRSLTDYTNYYYDDLPDTRRVSLSVKYHLGGKLQSGQQRRIEEQDRL